MPTPNSNPPAQSQMLLSPFQSIKPQTLALIPIVEYYVDQINKDFNSPVNREVRQLMVKSLITFIEKATDKFIKGQLEHGGDIRDRNLNAEIFNETVDLMWYNAANQWPKADSNPVMD